MQIEMFQNKPTQLHNGHKDTCCAGVHGWGGCVSQSVVARSVAAAEAAV